MILIQAVGFANGAPCPIAGQFLESFDVDAYEGRGFAVYTRDKKKAMHFADIGAAMTFWKTQSKVRPLRFDGQPNRPLTSTTITFVEAL